MLSQAREANLTVAVFQALNLHSFVQKIKELPWNEQLDELINRLLDQPANGLTHLSPSINFEERYLYIQMGVLRFLQDFKDLQRRKVVKTEI